MSKTRASVPCLSLWERWPSAARTERVYKTAIPSHTELHALQAIKIFFKDFNWSSVSDARHAALSGCLGNGCRNNVLDSRVKGCREDIIRVQFLVGDQRGNRAHGPESPWALFYMVKPEYSGSSAMGWAIPPNHGLAGAAAKPIHSATSTMAAPVITS